MSNWNVRHAIPYFRLHLDNEYHLTNRALVRSRLLHLLLPDGCCVLSSLLQYGTTGDDPDLPAGTAFNACCGNSAFKHPNGPHYQIRRSSRRRRSLIWNSLSITVLANKLRMQDYLMVNIKCQLILAASSRTILLRHHSLHIVSRDKVANIL